MFLLRERADVSPYDNIGRFSAGSWVRMGGRFQVLTARAGFT